MDPGPRHQARGDTSRAVLAAIVSATLAVGASCRLVSSVSCKRALGIRAVDCPAGWTDRVVLSGDLACFCDEAGLVVDVSDPSRPVLAGSYKTRRPAHNVTLSGTLAYVSTGQS